MRMVEVAEEREMGGLTDAEASTEVAVVAVRIRMNHPAKVWVVIVIKTYIVDGLPTETQEEKGNPIMPFVMPIIETAITEGRTRLPTHQVVVVVREDAEAISHTKQAVAMADEESIFQARSGKM